MLVAPEGSSVIDQVTAVIDTQTILLGGDVILEVNGVVVEGGRQSYLNVLSRIGRSESKLSYGPRSCAAQRSLSHP